VIDPNLHEIAVPLIINADSAPTVDDNLRKAAQLGKDGQPLSPIVLRALQYAVRSDSFSASAAALSVHALAAIDPDDDEVNHAVLALLRNPNAAVKYAAAKDLCTFKNARSGMSALLLMARTGNDDTLRAVAIEDLVTISDDDNRAGIKKQLERMKYDKSPAVRKAVEQALDEFGRE
jgi:HEAT repeat protein